MKISRIMAIGCLLAASLSPSQMLGADNDVADKYKDEGYKLVWAEEFDVDGKPNPEIWKYEHGYVRNRENQWYQEDNAIVRNGRLEIECRLENPDAAIDQKRYTSSSINTRGTKDFKYGRFEIRAKIPTAAGSWPAIWLLGVEHPWPANGEIDIMEYYRINGVPHILANACWGSATSRGGEWDSAKIPYKQFIDKDINWGDKFHIWRMDWDENAIKIYVDDELLNEIELSKTVNTGNAAKGFNPFTQPQYILLNLAYGGINGGELVDEELPLTYLVDYVRVYQK